jgi:outer membrane usher protein
MRCRRKFLLVAASLLASACRAAVALPPAIAIEGATAAVIDLFLEVSVNGEATGQLQRFRQGPGGLRTSAEQLRQLGLDPHKFGLKGDEEEIDLNSVRGLRYEYDAGRQTLALLLDDALRSPLGLQARQVAAPPRPRASPGIVLNYDLIAQLRPQRSVAIFNELRYFDDNGVFSSTGLATIDKQTHDYLRYDSAWTWSDPDTLRSLQLGDAISSSLPWGRSVRIGGVQWRKSFTLRPDLLTYPVAAVQGSATLPSSVSVYVNGIQQYSAEVPAGPFVVNQVAGLSGAGEATVVTRDELGRSVVKVVPLYVDTRLLAKDFMEYSVEAGVMRKDYGSKSFGYRQSPVASGTLRHGWSDQLTLEAHAEAASGLVQAGGGAFYSLGQSGVINGNLAVSSGRDTGGLAGAGYQYISRGFGVEFQTQRSSQRFADIAVRDGTLPVRQSDRATLTVALPAEQSVGFSVIAYAVPQAPPARIVALSYSMSIARRVFFSVSAFRDFKNSNNSAVFFGISTAFGDRIAANVSSGRQNGERQRNYGVQRAPDYEGGPGWALQQGTVGSTEYRQAQAQYLGRYGQVNGIVQSNGASTNVSVEVTGALVAMDGAFAAARSVGGGFALVSTGLAGVPVVHENRTMGVTDGSGHFLVPNLNPYAANRLSIDSSTLPVDMRAPVQEVVVAPRRLSGLLVNLEVTRYRAAIVILHDAAGKPLPLGATVRHAESGSLSIVGYDGMAFVENVAEENHLQVGSGAAACEVSFRYADSAQPSLPTIGPLACGNKEKE